MQENQTIFVKINDSAQEVRKNQNFETDKRKKQHFDNLCIGWDMFGMVYGIEKNLYGTSSRFF
jgi:hypothetical protein